jgi:hypothetical protein
VPETESVWPTASEEVATFAKVFAPLKYGMFPITAAVDVERPPYVNAPVVLLYASGKVAERLVEDTLLLKTVQSAEERYPSTEPVALAMERVPPAPPTSAPKVPEYARGPLMAREEVATDWRAFVPLP